MNYYEVDFTFFIESGNEDSIATKDNLLDELDTLDNVDVYDVYDDGEDWCVNCIAEVKCKSINHVDWQMHNLLKNCDVCWDYHYIKGIINNFN